jgi:putative two-component system response regulator
MEAVSATAQAGAGTFGGDMIARIRAARILVVDDSPDQRDLLELVLRRERYVNIDITSDPTSVAAAYAAQPYDLILLDMDMPEMSGLDVMHALKDKLQGGAFMPVIILTANEGADMRMQALSRGARDYIAKPYVASEVALRIRNYLEVLMLYRERERQNEILELRVQERTAELRETQAEILRRLAKAGEYRDSDTGNHVQRVAASCRALARAAGLDATAQDLIYMSSPLHDIGKIGIPDGILLKKGRLTDEEQEVMRRHVQYGAEMLDNHEAPVLRMARAIVLNHHEKWDGTGYPEGRAGEDIPIEARIAAICDVFDALMSVRPYKLAWSVAEALQFLKDNAGLHFDPRLIDLFMGIQPEIADIRMRFADPVQGSASPSELAEISDRR